jgi:peptidoglycan hydrolase-like protein with peptidoglycan-binding domain
MATISASVGAKGKNRKADVETVQRLLNKHLAGIGRQHPLEVDGNAGSETIGAIVAFQGRVMSMVEPDGRIDPGGRTMKALTKEALNLVQLPKQGSGYYHYAKASQQYGTTKTIASVKRAAKALHQVLGIEVGVGHISLRNGGKFPPHKTHQRGRDVDFRPVRADGKRLPVTVNNATQYSRAHTRKLVQVLRRDPNLDVILFNDESIAGVKNWPGHDNHLHVRFKE